MQYSRTPNEKEGSRTTTVLFYLFIFFYASRTKYGCVGCVPLVTTGNCTNVETETFAIRTANLTSNVREHPTGFIMDFYFLRGSEVP